MKNLQKYIFPYLKQFQWLLLVTVILGILTFLTSSALTFTSGYLITRASEMPLNILLIYVPVVLVRAFGIARPVSRYLERLSGHNIVLKILSEMRAKLYKVLEPQALFIRSRFRAGDILGTLADDIEHLQDAYIRTIFPTVTALFLFLSSVVVLSIFDWKFAVWIAFLLILVVFIYPLYSLYFMKKRKWSLKETKARLYQSLTDTVFGLSDMLISGKEERFFQTFFKDANASDEIEKKMAFWNYSRTFQLQIVTAVILVSVGLWAGNQALKGELLPTYIASFTLVVLPLLEGMIPISAAAEKIPAYVESLERIELFEPVTMVEGSAASSVVPAKKPDIVLQNVEYRYDGAEEIAINNLSLHIPYGQKIAVLGKSGSGKSTLLQLLIGALQPQKGTILVGEKSPREYGEQISDTIGVLNQKPYLFATSVENNIRLGKKDAKAEEILSAVERVGLAAYILSLPEGLGTQMEESGQRFSGGERQRIALARILLKDTPIVILDEPTIGLDPVTERDLLETIFRTLENKTVIMITHHLMGLEKMDKIIFLEEGKMIMAGTNEDLLAESERYRKLYEMDRAY